MSGRDETKCARERIRRNAQVAERERQRIRQNRNNEIKRWTSKLSTIAFTILVCVLVYSFLVGPVNCSMNTTIATGKGNFDKIVVNYEPIGDSTTKTFLVAVEAPDKEFIATANVFSFYDRSIEFFITVYINGLAQPTENFVLRTEGIEAISCKNNITISFTFGVVKDVIVPFYQTNQVAPLFIILITFLSLLAFLAVSWGEINHRWRYRRY